MHDVLTFQVVRPLLEKKLAGDVKRKKVKEEVGQAGAIIDLTDMDDIASEAVDKMFDEGDSLKRKQEECAREDREEKVQQAVKRSRYNYVYGLPFFNLASRLQEIFPQVQIELHPLPRGPWSGSQGRQTNCHDAYDGKAYGGVKMPK